MIKTSFLYCFCFVLLLGTRAQNITVEGRAHPSYIGKVVEAYSELDLVSGIEHREALDTIGKDGYFDLHLHSETTQLLKLRIERAVMQLYVEPDYIYGITVPETDPAYKYGNGAELPLDIGIIGSDSTELNALMFDYQKLYNNFFAGDEERFLSRPMMFRRADSLRKVCALRYAGIKNQYFLDHVKYSIASVNASVSRGENSLIQAYIAGHPILYRNSAYMDFFEACFNGYLNAAATGKSTLSLQYLINNEPDYARLSAYFKDDRFLKNDSLRELVILHNLWGYYFSPEYNQDGVKQIITQIRTGSKIEEHKRIALNMLNYMNRLRAGSEAPLFSARAANGKMGSLQMFRGKWVYLNFFSTANEASLREMPKMLALKKKFGDKVMFLSICLDDSLKTYTNYLRANPKFDWPIWFSNQAGLSRTARQAYSVTGTEAYFLIDKLGTLAQSPALSPSQGIENRFNLLFKPKRKNTKTGIR